MADTATIAERKVIQDESEKRKNPPKIVKSRPVSEYGARTPARSFA